MFQGAAYAGTNQERKGGFGSLSWLAQTIQNVAEKGAIAHSHGVSRNDDRGEDLEVLQSTKRDLESESKISKKKAPNYQDLEGRFARQPLSRRKPSKP